MGRHHVAQWRDYPLRPTSNSARGRVGDSASAESTEVHTAMSQAHATEMMRLLSLGADPEVQALTLKDYEIDEKSVVDLPDSTWSLAKEDSYCPVTDIPRGEGMTRIDKEGNLWVLGNNGMCLFGFKLERRPT